MSDYISPFMREEMSEGEYRPMTSSTVPGKKVEIYPTAYIGTQLPSAVQGSVLIHCGGMWKALPPGPEGYVLTSSAAFPCGVGWSPGGAPVESFWVDDLGDQIVDDLGDNLIFS